MNAQFNELMSHNSKCKLNLTAGFLSELLCAVCAGCYATLKSV